MKATPLYLLILLFACTAKKDPVLISLEEMLLPKMDDQDSYEFVSLEHYDTITYGVIMDVFTDPSPMDSVDRASLVTYSKHDLEGSISWKDMIDKTKKSIADDSVKVLAENNLKQELSGSLNTPVHYYYKYTF